jgi:DNA mismatch endonuclease (patch repair protein)
LPSALPYPVPTSPNVTSAMKGNRRADTKPELALRSALHRRGLRFRKDAPVSADGLSVRPDVVFTREQVAVFVDGCFWHGCPDHGNTPRANTNYWGPKLARNAKRDRLVTTALTRSGWMVLRVWEHEEAGEAADRVAAALLSRRNRRPT